MQRDEPTPTERRRTRVGRARRGGLAVAALLVATAGLTVAATTTGAEAAAAKKAAITVTRLSGVPKSTTGAGAFKVTATVRNASPRPAKAAVTIRLSRDRKLDGKDKQLTSAKTGKLRPRATTRVKASVRLPKVLAEGTYHVFACVGSTCKSAKTFVRRSTTPPPSKSDRGRLSGTLSFTRTALEGWSTTDDETKVEVAMGYQGPFAVSNDLVNTSSTASYDHTHSKTEITDQGCTTTTTDTTKAARPLVVTGDRYTDEIYGDIVYNDFSELDVDLNLEYLYTTKVVKGGGAHCPQGTTESTHKSWDVMSIRLRKVSRTGSDITYRVKSAQGTYGGSTSWQDITGTLTLHLG